MKTLNDTKMLYSFAENFPLRKIPAHWVNMFSHGKYSLICVLVVLGLDKLPHTTTAKTALKTYPPLLLISSV